MMGDVRELAQSSAWKIARVLASGAAGPVELVDHLLAQAMDSQKVFLEITGERALVEAEQSARRLAEGRPLSALDGVPVAFKDLFDMAGEVTSAGSLTRAGAVAAGRDAAAVARARAAGMVVLGKLNLSEFAYSGLGLNPHFGTPPNPHDGANPRVPGGSSSGSGVAVARGLVPVAIGTDTGGSVRIPAAFNGIVGFKSSEGRLDRSGVFALSPSFDTIGPLARTVQDCIAMDMVMRGRKPRQPEQRSIAGQRFIVPQAIVLEGLEDAVADNFERSLGQIGRAGGRIERLKFEVFSSVVELGAKYGSIVAAEAFEQHWRLMKSAQAELVDPRVAVRIMAGGRICASDLSNLKRERSRLSGELDVLVDDALVLMPTTAMTAPEIAPLEADADLFHKTNMLALRNTSLGNFLNMPGLALPNGFDRNGLPTSLLVSSRGGQDDVLLRSGLEIEKVLKNARR